MENHFLIPRPPFEAAIDPMLQTWITGFMGLAAATALVYSLIDWRRCGRPTFLMLFVGGGCMMVLEPLVDTVGACWFPEGNSWVAFHAYGRPIPVWLCLCYFFYFGIGVGITWRLMRNGITRTALWWLFVGEMTADFAMEVLEMHFDTYYYYGWQPLVVFKFPLWWAPVNALITMVAGAVVYRFEWYLQGIRQLMIIPALLSVSAAVNAIAGWPSWFVINTDVGPVLTQLGGIMTFVIALWFMELVISQVAKGSPAGAPLVLGPVSSAAWRVQ